MTTKEKNEAENKVFNPSQYDKEDVRQASKDREKYYNQEDDRRRERETRPRK